MAERSHTNSTREYVLKFVLVGDSNVGKSQLALRFCKNEFDPESSTTIGMEFATKSLQFINTTIKAQLWDTAGQERFESMTNAYYRDAVGAFLVYDVCNAQSFANIGKWLNQVRSYGHENMLIALIGNKTDSPSNKRRVSTVQGFKFAQQHNMDFLETSAKSGQNVETAFRRLIMSVSRLLPEVRQNPVAPGLPDGWVQCSNEVYENYWTGERSSERPEVPAPQGQQLAATYSVADVSVRESRAFPKKAAQSSWNCTGSACAIL